MTDRNLPTRKSIRLPGYDYAAPNWYLVTICAAERRPVFGEISGTEMVLSDAGQVVERRWLRLPEFYPRVGLENFIVMPNHIHGILVIGEPGPAPQLSRQRKHRLSEIVRGFKSMSAREINRGTRDRRPLWQRGYYEHIIRDDADLARIREYIDNNPIAWANDPENPIRIP
jgi:REP element-mobilizing transposase RayT